MSAPASQRLFDPDYATAYLARVDLHLRQLRVRFAQVEFLDLELADKLQRLTRAQWRQREGMIVGDPEGRTVHELMSAVHGLISHRRAYVYLPPRKPLPYA